MKIRLILLSLLGLAAYIVLANFNSKMLKDPVPERHTQASVPQPHSAKNSEPVKTFEHPDIPYTKVPTALPAEPQQTAAPQEQAGKPSEAAPTLKIIEPPSQGVTVQPQAVNTGKLQQLQDELAQKELQIRQLLDAQEALAAKSRSLMTLLDAGTADVAAKDRLLQEVNDQIKTLTADKNTKATELENAKSTIEQLNTALKKSETTGINSEHFIKEKETLLKTVQQQIQEKNAEVDSLKAQLADTATHLQSARTDLVALTADKNTKATELEKTKSTIEQLNTALKKSETAGIESEHLLKEKEALLKSLQQQIHERNAEAVNLKAQLADTAARLQAVNAALVQADLKATSLLHLSQEKEKMTVNLEQQKNVLEMSLQEKTEALTEALRTIQSLSQEVAGHPQALETVQNQLDERNKEFDQLKEVTTVQIEQQSRQIADLSKNNKQALAEFNKCKTEMSAAQKKVTDLESAQAPAQTALKEAEQKLTVALHSTNTLQNQLNAKDTAISAIKVQMSELLTKTSALNDEKIGLAWQLKALQGDHENLLGIKASFEEKSAALEDAMKQGKELTSVQAQLSELQEKYKALTAQADANANTIKQLESEKTGLAEQLAASPAEKEAVETLKKSLNEKNSALLLAETKIKDLTKANEQIAELQAKLKDTTAAQQALQSAKQTAEQKVAESESVLKSLNQSLASSSDKEKILTTELAAAQTKIKDLMDKNYIQQQQDLVPNLNQQIATLREQVAQMAANESQAKKNLAEISAAMQVKAEATQTTDKKIQTLQTEKDGLQKQLDELKKQAQPPPQQPAAPSASSVLPDRDKDGIADTADFCPDSPASVPVNALGCPEKKGILLEGVTFKTNTAILLPDGLKNLDRVAASLAQLSQVKVEIAGHTDSVGDPKRNQELSTLRAQTVAKYLAEKGVATERLTAKGYGQDKPIADNTTSAGKQKNRRVELYPLSQ